MDKFLYLFRGGETREQLSPEEMQAHMQKWGQWMQELAEKGNFDSGLPLEKGGKVVENSGEVITDGPFTEGKEVVGGYLIVNAESVEEATELSKDCPIFEHRGSVEVRKILPMDN